MAQPDVPGRDLDADAFMMDHLPSSEEQGGIDYSAFAARLLDSFGLLATPFRQLCLRLAEVPPPPRRQWTLREQTTPSEALAGLLPLAHPTKYLFFPLTEEWTAVVDNGRDGPEFADLQGYLTGHWNGITVRVVDQRSTFRMANGYRVRMSWEARIVEVYDGANLVRSVACANDGGRWVFETAGDPLPVEGGFSYDAKRKPDRFTSDNLGQFLGVLGARRPHPEDLLDSGNFLVLDEIYKDPDIQRRGESRACTLAEADDPAYGYWLRATSWIEHMETHAESAVLDLTRAVALNPSYGPKADPYLSQAKRQLGAKRYAEVVAQATTLLIRGA